MRKLWFAALLASGCVAGEAELPKAAVDAPAPVVREYAHPVKVDYMVRGYFYAGSSESEGLGGNGSSENMPKHISKIRNVITATDGLHVLALADEDRQFGDLYDGFRVIVANASNDKLMFEAQDSRLEIVHEAIDPSGKWAPIEYLPSSWCGNSYHRLALPANSYWEFTAPRYDGDFATRLRIRVAVGERDHQHFTYSDEFPSRISRKQFTEKQGHAAQSIMDPYND